MLPSKFEQVAIRLEDYEWLKQQRSRLRNRWDLICPVLGDVGKGKSTCAIQFAQVLDPSFVQVVDGEVRFPRLCYSTREARDVAETAPKYSAIVLDEAHEGAMAMEWQQRENKEFAKFAVYCRKRHLAIFICIPDLNLLLKFLRTQRCQDIFWFERRGRAFRYHGEKGLWQKEMFRTFEDAIKLPPMPPKVEKAYHRYAREAERAARAESDDPDDNEPDIRLDAEHVQAAKEYVQWVLDTYPSKVTKARI